MNPLTKLWNSVVGWFTAPAVDEELPCRDCARRNGRRDKVAAVISVSELKAELAAGEKRMRDFIARTQRNGEGL